jgi:two-component system chemotaxis response regulator CheB
LFVSAAEAYGERVIGVVLSGADGESAQGLKAIMDHGGEALVEDREEAHRPGMSRTAVAGDCVSIPEVAKVLRNRCWH